MKADRQRVLGWQPMRFLGWGKLLFFKGLFIRRFFWFCSLKSLMKTSCFVFTLLASTLMRVQAQVTGAGATTTAKQPVLPAPTAYGVVEQGANHRVWERTVYEQGPNGTVIGRKHQVTELATGLNYLQNGQWKESKEEIDILPNGGAAATRGAHQV
jgi:hypothetical protein